MKYEGEEQPYLLMVRNGPVWSIEDHLGFFARVLGARFEGEICTYGNKPGFLREGGITVHRFVWKRPRDPISRLFYSLRVTLRAMRVRWLKGRRIVIVAYDPFQSGMIGCLVKWTTGARFICEVNGVYGDDANLIDVPDPDRRRARKRAMLRTGSFVLKRADFIKTLFPGQLSGFHPSVLAKPSTWFFDLVDSDVFQSAGLPARNRIVFVGHPFHRKAVDVLLAAFSRARAEHPDWTLAIIGWGLEPIARELALPSEGVEFVPPQSPAALAREIEQAAALVLPSRSEAMGRVLLEAALLERPRLGSRVGGIPYYIEDDVDGLLFEPDDVDSLAAVLLRFMSDPELRERLGRAARIRAEREFTGDEYVRRYTEVFEQVLG